VATLPYDQTNKHPGGTRTRSFRVEGPAHCDRWRRQGRHHLQRRRRATPWLFRPRGR